MPRQRIRLSADIEALAHRLAAYRNNLHRQRQLPEKLWAQAVVLARQHGLCRVLQALHLNYYDLKRRMEALPPPLPESSHSLSKSSPAFVELGVSPLVSAGTILELEDRTGRKLTVRLASPRNGELLAMAQAMWSAGT